MKMKKMPNREYAHVPHHARNHIRQPKSDRIFYAIVYTVITLLTISVLYELINTRMLCHRPTIYTSNIVDSSIFEARYTEKVASRILGSCQIFKFFGTDQRLKRGGKR